jgi:hypothetical protein
VTCAGHFDLVDSLWDPGVVHRPGSAPRSGAMMGGSVLLTARRHVDLLRVIAAACR